VERELEEIYYSTFVPVPVCPGFAFHRDVRHGLSAPIEISEEVRAGDVVLTPHGFHGPSMAARATTCTTFNVMAGPAADGTWFMTRRPGSPLDPWHLALPGRRPSLADDPTRQHHQGRTVSNHATTAAEGRVSPDSGPGNGSASWPTSTANETGWSSDSLRASSASLATGTWPAWASTPARTRLTRPWGRTTQVLPRP